MTAKYQIEINRDSQVHQGDVFHNVPYYEEYIEEHGQFTLNLLQFPYAIILTQECDLMNNHQERLKKKTLSNGKFEHDKYLISLLCAPLYNADHLFEGSHLSEIGLKSEYKNSQNKSLIKTNRDPRYHYIEFDDSVTRLVPMVVDFKHYFSINLRYLEKALDTRTCSIKPLYRELITQRFSNFLSRIGLPEPELNCEETPNN